MTQLKHAKNVLEERKVQADGNDYKTNPKKECNA